MTLEQMLKWKRGSFEEFENILNNQERLLKRIKKLNIEIEKVEDVRSCFNIDNPNEIEKWMRYDDEVKKLIKQKERLGLQVKENNERLEREFY